MLNCFIPYFFGCLTGSLLCVCSYFYLNKNIKMENLRSVSKVMLTSINNSCKGMNLSQAQIKSGYIQLDYQVGRNVFTTYLPYNPDNDNCTHFKVINNGSVQDNIQEDMKVDPCTGLLIKPSTLGNDVLVYYINDDYTTQLPSD